MSGALDLRAGEAVEGKYRILMELGEGGTAKVSLAVARGPSGFNKLVVCKTLERALSDDPVYNRRDATESKMGQGFLSQSRNEA